MVPAILLNNRLNIITGRREGKDKVAGKILILDQ
jgi:hypothetical protein